MIEQLQKTRLTARLLLADLQSGKFPSVPQVVDRARQELFDRGIPGQPLTRLLPAVPGLPIGGESGQDVMKVYQELREDLDLLYEALLKLSVNGTDLYEVFATRRDNLALRLKALKIELLTLLAQLHAGGQYNVFDSFNTLEMVDLIQTTAYLDLDEGSVLLKPDAQNSLRYDGSRVKLVRERTSDGSQAHFQGNFLLAFSPYRLDSWYATLGPNTYYEAVVNVTGADYNAGGTEEILLNAVRVQPTGPLHVEIEWSPDGYNFHPLGGGASRALTDSHTFHFKPVRVGYLRFRVRRSPGASTSAEGEVTPVGIKRIELFQRGYTSFGQLFSREWELPFPVSSVVSQLDQELPYGTEITAYVSQDGTNWFKLNAGPTLFENTLTKTLALTSFELEEDDNPRIWKATVPDFPLPETGQLISGVDQVYLEAFPFHWDKVLDPRHLPSLADFEAPINEKRGDCFRPRGVLEDPNGSADGFVSDRNPLVLHEDGYLCLCLIQSDGQLVLQPGYNYRLVAHVWCPSPKTLENQKIAVVNNLVGESADEVAVAPLSVYVNEEKVYEKETAAPALSYLALSNWQTRINLRQGWNKIELLVQLPGNFAAGQNGVASSDVYVVFQPNVFDPNRRDELGIEELRAFPDSWKKVSDFDLRYNTPIGLKEVWAWKLDSRGRVQYLVTNHNPLNDPTGTYWTIDGQNRGQVEQLALTYTVELPKDNTKSLYFRADLKMSPEAASPPVLHSYKLLVN